MSSPAGELDSRKEFLPAVFYPSPLSAPSPPCLSAFALPLSGLTKQEMAIKIKTGNCGGPWPAAPHSVRAVWSCPERAFSKAPAFRQRDNPPRAPPRLKYRPKDGDPMYNPQLETFL